MKSHYVLLIACVSLLGGCKLTKEETATAVKELNEGFVPKDGERVHFFFSVKLPKDAIEAQDSYCIYDYDSKRDIQMSVSHLNTFQALNKYIAKLESSPDEDKWANKSAKVRLQSIGSSSASVVPQPVTSQEWTTAVARHERKRIEEIEEIKKTVGTTDVLRSYTEGL
jgi:hypothetical protein